MAIGKELRLFFIYNKKIGVSRRNGLPNGNGKRLFFVIWKLTTVTCQNILNVEVGTFGIFLGFLNLIRNPFVIMTSISTCADARTLIMSNI